MSDAILFVDDEPHLLAGITRVLRDHFDIKVATSGAEGLKILEASGPFAVVISDMRMPEMNGAQFLSKVRERAPDTVRIILSGHSDLQQAIAAVNDGNIFRFLTKPCATHSLVTALRTAVEQYRLINAEKVLLEQTLTGAVNVMIEILSFAAPSAYSRARRLQRYCAAVVAALGLRDNWQWPLAALLSQIGFISLPKDVVSKFESEKTMSEEEGRLLQSHPQMAAKMLEAIPRLETVAAIVASQNAGLSDKDAIRDLKVMDARSAGIVLLHAAVEFDRRIAAGNSAEDAVAELRSAELNLPVAVLDALRSVPITTREHVLRSVRLCDLAPGMLLDEGLQTRKGIALAPAGQEITLAMLARLCGIDSTIEVQEPFRVRIPV